jgi:hypothetical protein
MFDVDDIQIIESTHQLLTYPIVCKMFRGKCGFCRQPGHNVAMCQHRDKQIVIDHMERQIERCRSKYEIRQYLNTLSKIRLEILASQLRLPNGSPSVFVKNRLVEYYNATMVIRDARLQRYYNDIEAEHTDRYSARSPLPHTLFRQCLSGIQEMCIALSQLKTRFINGYASVPLNPRETDVFRRGWKIIPDLGVADLDKAECPICLEKAKHTNYVLPLCKHGMCNTCFIKFVDGGSILKAPLCPMCREVIRTVDVFDVQVYNTIASKYVVD